MILREGQPGRLAPAPSTVPALLAARAAESPDHVALAVEGIATLRLSEWARKASACADELKRRGVRPGDRVGLAFTGFGWLAYAVSYVAVTRAGAVAVPISAQAPVAEMAYVLNDCGAVGLLHEGGVAPGLTSGWAGGWSWAFQPGDSESGEDGEDLAVPGGLAQILYTSGTTARPKGVAATHANLTYGAGARRRPFAHSRHLAHAFAIGTNAGQVMLMNALLANPTVVTAPMFTPARFVRLIEAYAAGTVFMVPTMAIEVLSSGAHARHDLSCVRLLGSAAAPLPAPVAAALAAAFPHATIANYYTSTEAAPAQTVMLYDADRPNSVGRAISGSGVRIADADGRPLQAGEIGDVWMRSPAQTRTYFGDAAGTAASFRDGWIRMGDVGYLDAEGYLYLLDRDSDIVKSGGHRVSTLQVEAALHEHPLVIDAAVVGLPHAALGTQLAAALVVRDAVPAHELRAFLLSKLAPHEVPARVIELDALPRNRGGKVDKTALRRSLS